MYISTDYNKPVSEQAKQAFDQVLANLIADYEKQIATLKARADDTIPKIRTDIVECNQFGKMTDPSNYEKETGWSYRTRSIEEIEKIYTEELDKNHIAVEETHKNNLAAIENNKIIIDKLEKLLKSIGVPDSYQERDHNTRSYKAKYKTVYGFRTDLGKIKTFDGYESALDTEKRLRTRLTEYIKQRKEKDTKEKAEKEAKVLVEKILIQFGAMAAKYGLTEDNTKEELLDIILEKDKYLRLAHYLELNRGNWNDGYSYAETGLNRFKVETEEDQLIYDDINSYITDWDGDGRVFRDCKYNYGVLFSKVTDEQLFKDYEIVNGWVDKF